MSCGTPPSSVLYLLYSSAYNNTGLTGERLTELAGLRQDLPRQYSSLCTFFIKNSQIEDEEIAQLQVQAYNQFNDWDSCFATRLALAMAYYVRGRRFEARKELLTLLEGLPEVSVERTVRVALVLAAAGDCTTALRVVSAFRNFEVQTEILPFFRQLQAKRDYLYAC